MPDALFDAGAKRAKHGETRALVAMEAGRCPRCGSSTEREVVEEDALLRHGGHGATRRSVREHCTCGFSLLTEQTEVRPPRSTE